MSIRRKESYAAPKCHSLNAILNIGVEWGEVEQRSSASKAFAGRDYDWIPDVTPNDITKGIRQMYATYKETIDQKIRINAAWKTIKNDLYYNISSSWKQLDMLENSLILSDDDFKVTAGLDILSREFTNDVREFNKYVKPVLDGSTDEDTIIWAYHTFASAYSGLTSKPGENNATPETNLRPPLASVSKYTYERAREDIKKLREYANNHKVVIYKFGMPDEAIIQIYDIEFKRDNYLYRTHAVSPKAFRGDRGKPLSSQKLSKPRLFTSIDSIRPMPTWTEWFDEGTITEEGRNHNYPFVPEDVKDAFLYIPGAAGARTAQASFEELAR